MRAGSGAEPASGRRPNAAHGRSRRGDQHRLPGFKTGEAWAFGKRREAQAAGFSGAGAFSASCFGSVFTGSILQFFFGRREPLTSIS